MCKTSRCRKPPSSSVLERGLFCSGGCTCGLSPFDHYIDGHVVVHDERHITEVRQPRHGALGGRAGFDAGHADDVVGFVEHD